MLTESLQLHAATPNSIRPEPNVVVAISTTTASPIRRDHLQTPLNQRPKAIFDGWVKTAPTNAVWDYWRVFQLHAPGLFAPYVNISAIRSDLQLFHRSGVRYVTVECEILGSGFDPHPQSSDLQSFMTLKTWVGMKLLEDPSRESGPLVSDILSRLLRRWLPNDEMRCTIGLPNARQDSDPDRRRAASYLVEACVMRSFSKGRIGTLMMRSV